MKAVIFAGYYVPHTGGYIKNIHELATRLVVKGHEVTIITGNTESSKRFEMLDGIHIIRVPVWKALNNEFPIPKPSRLLWYVLHSRHDVVLTQTRFFVTSLLGCIYARWRNIPLIHVERGTVHTVTGSVIVRFLAQVYDHTLGTLVVKSAKVNVGVSQAACRFIEHIGGKNTRVIYNGISIREYITDAHDPVLSVIYVGRAIFAKGIQDLISAVESVRKEGKVCRLTIVGDGTYLQELKKQASQSVESYTHFTGELDHAGVMAMLSMSDIFVNPSYSEGLPTSVMEAASVGLPIIATDVGGTNEIIEDNKSGLLYKAGDVAQLTRMLKYLINNLDRARYFGDKAKETVAEKFDWEVITEQYDRLLKEMKR